MEITMRPVSRATEPVSATIGDTLSKSEQEDLHQVPEPTTGSQTRDNSVQNEEEASTFTQVGQNALTSIEQFVKTHPYESAGIAMIGGALFYSLFSGKK